MCHLTPPKQVQDQDQSGFTNGLNEHNGAMTTQISSAESDTVVRHKVHIRGLDDLTTRDIKDFSGEHFPTDAPVRVEWIDDTSANIVFESPEICAQAFEHFLSPSECLESSMTTPELQLRPAKPLSTHPGSTLSVRIALATDQKQRRAHESSRFYLMHPEHDPREKRRHDRSRRGSSGGYQKRRFGDDEHRRRRNKDYDNGFDASMYDDNGSSSTRNSITSSQGGRSGRLLDSYRPVRDTGDARSRDRSASPGELDGDRSRLRKRTPPPSYRSRDPHPFPTENKGKELFPSKNAKAEGKDLFSNKLLASKMKTELFPHRASAVNHRRSDAFDAADETADLFATKLDSSKAKSRSLADRIAQASESYGRLNLEDPVARVDTLNKVNDNGLNIRGASQGVSIRGAASQVGTIKELFPGNSNAGKELFAEKLEGRGGKRQKAEDMFY